MDEIANWSPRYSSLPSDRQWDPLWRRTRRGAELHRPTPVRLLETDFLSASVWSGPVLGKQRSLTVEKQKPGGCIDVGGGSGPKVFAAFNILRIRVERITRAAR